MIIEFGFQANCSELTTYLGIRTIPEICDAMRKMQEIEEWSWRIETWNKSDDENASISNTFVYLPLPMQRLEEFIVLKRTLNEIDPNFRDTNPNESPLEFPIFGIDEKKIRSYWNQLDKGLEDEKLSLDTMHEYDPPIPTLMNIPNEVEVHSSDKSLDGIFISFDDPDVDWDEDSEDEPPDYSDAELHVWTHDNVIELMPTMHEISNVFVSEPMGSGGLFDYYAKWMAWHFLNDNNFHTKYIERLDLTYRSNFNPKSEMRQWEVWRKRNRMCYEQYPPLKISENPSDLDFDCIARIVNFTYENVIHKKRKEEEEKEKKNKSKKKKDIFTRIREIWKR